ncbi:MAG: hypothetical protein R6U17_03430 [Thermoplasmata archaeon]
MFSIDVIKSYRLSKKKIAEHPLMTVWFFGLLVAGIWMTLIVIVLIAAMDEPFIEPTKRDILFSLFFILMAKASAEASEDTVKNKSLKYYFAAPVRSFELMMARILKVLWYNLALVAVVMSIVVLIIRVQNLALPAGSMFFIILYALIILAPLAGFNIAIFSHQEDLKTKVMLVASYGQLMGLLWFVLHPSIGPWIQLLFITILIIYSLAVSLVSTSMVKGAWVAGTRSKDHKVLRFHSRKDFLPSIIPYPIRKIAQGEILRRWRNRQIPATLGVTVLLSVGLLFIYRQLGPNPDIGLDLGKYFYPALIGITIYTAVVVHSVIPSLTLFSRDGNRLWALRTTPVDVQSIVWGKSSSSLLFTPLTCFILVLPVTLVLSYPAYFIIFAFTASFNMYFFFTGIGVLMGIFFPNFDESNRGSPDVMTMYISLMLCLIGAVFLLGPPTVIMETDRFLGLMACILSTDFAALLMVGMFRYSGKKYGGLEVDM